MTGAQNRSLIDLLERTRRIGTWVVDVAKAECHWSATTYQIHEEDPSKRIALEDGIQYYVPDDRPTIERCVEEGIANGQPWDVELRIRTAKGNVRWVRAIGEAIVEGDEVVALHGMFEDIHERKILELEREALLVRMLEAERLARMGHWKQTFEPDEIEWSPGMFALFAAPAGTPRTEPVDLSKVSADDVERVRAAVRAAGEGERGTVEFRVELDGHENWYQMVAFPVPGGRGPRAVAGVVSDVTEAVESKLEIDRLNTRLLVALEASGIGVWEWNVKTGGLIWDAQMYALYGRSAADFSGAYEAWENGLHPADKERTVAELQSAVEGGEKFDTQFRVIWPDTSEVRTLRAMASLHRGPDGEVETMVGANWDVSDIVRTRAELERSNQELAELAHRTSHDLKAPLTTIRRLAAYVLEDIGAGALDEATQNVEEVGRQAAVLESMVIGCLRAATADVHDVALEAVDLSQLVDQVVSSLGALAEQNEVTVERSVETRDAYLVPRSRVVQILSNLVTNAIKYRDPSRERSLVRIGVQRRSENIVMAVEDNGSGIPTDNVDEIYAMFRTLHPKGTSGDGLGLYIVKRQVERLGGEIRVESSPTGTRFEVEFFARASR